jgi:lipopolysaccharide heptosyltransferase I
VSDAAPVKILIIKTSSIGDVLHTMPAANALRRQWPNAHITWLVEEAAADLVINHPAINRTLVARRKSWVRDLKRLRLAALADLWRFIRQLRDTRYDMLIDFQALLKSSVWVAIAKSKRKIGFGRGMAHAEGSWLFLNERVPAVSMDSHAVERELLLLDALGVPRTPPEFRVPVTAADRDTAEHLLRESGVLGERPLFVLCPITLWPTKLWDNDKWAMAADRLIDAHCNVAFAGSPGDQHAIDEICRGMLQKPARLDGQTSLMSLAAVFERATAAITTDTGPMHLAAAIGTPVIALFGPTAPWRTGPWGDSHTLLRVDGLQCSPCYKKQCLTTKYEKHACLQRLTVEDVVAAALAKAGRTTTMTPLTTREK